MPNNDIVQQGERIVEGVKYLNMTRAANYLGYSPQGWREYRNKLVEAGELEVWSFGGKSFFVKEKDLEKLKHPKKVTLAELTNSDE